MKTNEHEQKNSINKFKSGVKSKKNQLPKLIILVSFSIAIIQLVYYKMTDNISLFSKDESVQVITVDSPAKSESFRSAISNQGESIAGNDSVQTPRNTAPPIIDSTSFNELQNLYLLTSRVRQGELRTAAEMYGLQRLNIQNLREQAKELRVQSEMDQYKLASAKALKDISDYNSGNLNQQMPKTSMPISDAGRDFMPSGIPSSQISALNQNNDKNSIPVVASYAERLSDIRVGLIMESTSSSPATTLLYVNGHPLRNVVEGQVVASLLKVDSIDFGLGCVSFTNIETKSPLIACAN